MCLFLAKISFGPWNEGSGTLKSIRMSGTEPGSFSQPFAGPATPLPPLPYSSWQLEHALISPWLVTWSWPLLPAPAISSLFCCPSSVPAHPSPSLTNKGNIPNGGQLKCIFRGGKSKKSLWLCYPCSCQQELWSLWLYIVTPFAMLHLFVFVVWICSSSKRAVSSYLYLHDLPCNLPQLWLRPCNTGEIRRNNSKEWEPQPAA